MEKSSTLLVTLLLVLILFTFADVEVNGTSKNVGDPIIVSTSNKSNGGNGKVLDPETKGKDQVDGGSKEKVVTNRKKPEKKDDGKQLEVKDGGGKLKKTNDLGSGQVGAEKDNVRKGSDPESKKGTLPPVRKDGVRGEECDSSSNSCTIEEKALVACLRVPGNESPDLSLLIQNKGKETVSVSISAPSFVHLENKQIQLQGKENNKVKVSIGNGGSGNTIVLTAGNGNCSLDFKDLIPQDTSKDSVPYFHFAYTNFLKSTLSRWFLLLAVILIIASIWMFISFRHKNLARDSSKYEKLDMELPVSSGVKKEVDSNDGWENSWDDNWDDEEAPHTPSMPVTPSLSSKGIASRRTNKEGWKG